MRQTFSLLCIITLLFLVSPNSKADASEQGHQPTAVLEQYQYVQKEKLRELIAQKQERAAKANKQLMLVFGAQWCHDSRALAEHFSDPVFDQALNERFEIEFVDVGYLRHGFEHLENFGLPVFYGTPTVVIINPDDKRVLNRADHQHWTNAASKSDKEYEEYFLHQNHLANFYDVKQGATIFSDKLKSFEYEQARRLKKAYEKLGPLLQRYKELPNENHDEFYEMWKEVRQFRVALDADIVRLQGLDGSAEMPLELPNYGPFSWEK